MTTEKPKLKQQDVDGLREVPVQPRGTRIDGYFGPGLLRPGVGKLVQRSGEPQFCGSMAFRVSSCDESPSRLFNDDDGKPKINRRFSGEFLGITYEGKHIHAAEGYIPKSIERSTQVRVDRGETVSFAGDLWCVPEDENSTRRTAGRGYLFELYDRRPRGKDDPLRELAVLAGIIEPEPEPERRVIERQDVDPETGEVIERDQRDAAE